MEVPAEKWMPKAQAWAQARANEAFKAWLQTKKGQRWLRYWGRKPPKLNKRVSTTVAQNSPYAHGFDVPENVHEMIAAIGRGDEVACKRIMLDHLTLTGVL